jgi:hypothetical protein
MTEFEANLTNKMQYDKLQTYIRERINSDGNLSKQWKAYKKKTGCRLHSI